MTRRTGNNYSGPRRLFGRPGRTVEHKGRCGRCGTSCTYRSSPTRGLWYHDEPGHDDHDPNTYIERTGATE